MRVNTALSLAALLAGNHFPTPRIEEETRKHVRGRRTTETDDVAFFKRLAKRRARNRNLSKTRKRSRS